MLRRSARIRTASRHRPKLGTGARFKALTRTLGKRKGVHNTGALAAWIGRRKLGAAKMAKLSARGRK